MTDQVPAPGPAAAPDPVGAADPAEYVARLRAYCRWSGAPSLRELAKLSGVPHSTVADALSSRRSRLPRLEVVLAVVRALGASAAQITDWDRSWRALQAGRNEQPPTPTMGPSQLPGGLADFTGRTDQVAAVRAGCEAPAPHPGVARLVAVTGVGGVGKTSLALHAAHGLRGRYPDGQLYANLFGAGPNPVPPVEVLGRFLRDLGTDPAAIPADEEARAAAYRSLVADRRVLIVLDDASGAAQVRPLIPASSTCTLVVTSRNRLAGLDGAVRVGLTALEPADAEALFGRLAGPAAAADPAATGEVLDACAGLPLAIRIAAARLVAEPEWTVRRLADRLADAGRRLSELRVEDRAVRVSFETSYANLTAAQSRAFRLLGLAPVRALGVPASAALLGCAPADAEELLSGLLGCHLLQPAGVDRYGLHDLIRLYAREVADAADEPAERTDALRRLSLWYLHGSRRAALALVPQTQLTDVPAAPDSMVLPEFDSPSAATAWCETERRNLVDLVASEPGDAALTWPLAHSMWAYLNLSRHWSDWTTVARYGLEAAQRCGDRQGEVQMLNNMGVLEQARADNARAVAWYRQALDRCDPDMPATTATVLANLAVSYRILGRLQDAADHYERALDAFRADGNRYGEAVCLLNLIPVHRTLGDLDRALDNCRLSLEAFRALDADYGVAHALYATSHTLMDAGRPAEALEPVLESLRIRRGLGDLDGQARSLERLGLIHRALDRVEEARAAWQESLELAERLKSPAAAAVRDHLAQLNNDSTVDIANRPETGPAR